MRGRSLPGDAVQGRGGDGELHAFLRQKAVLLPLSEGYRTRTGCVVAMYLFICYCGF